jgi:hypothetical protein
VIDLYRLYGHAQKTRRQARPRQCEIIDIEKIQRYHLGSIAFIAIEFKTSLRWLQAGLECRR